MSGENIEGISGLQVSTSLKEADEIIDKCYKEITASPDSITAYLATDLLAVISCQSQKLLRLVFNSFLLGKIIVPLSQGQVKETSL